jgi:type I restriction enzyme M protein
MGNFQEKVAFIWDLADLLRNAGYKRNEYQKVILPFTVLKRFDSVLEFSKKEVLTNYTKFKDKIDNLDPLLKSVSKDKWGKLLGFYNYSRYDFKGLLEDPEHIEHNFMHYLDCFSKNVQDIFDKNGFNIKIHIEKLAKHETLFRLVKKFCDSKVDLHPDVVSNQEMGTIFEELVRKFSEQSNEEAGEHFTPREVVDLMTHLMFETEEVDIKKKNLIKTVYDPACGTGGMLTGAKKYILTINKDVDVILYGQELNEETYAICKADMLMKGERSDNIKGPLSTLSKDQFFENRFDFIISNPPYGMKWENDKDEVEKEAKKGFEGRFGAGLPRINDGQLLFVQHMISKVKRDEKSRVAAITNGSPLFTGDAGQGESDIRKWIIENDMLEAIIALPNQLFYNTGINTYVWILSNDKPSKRISKIQLINATSDAFYKKMRKSLGDKRNELSEEHIQKIVSLYNKFEENEFSKIFDKEEFGYTKVIVERPMRLNYQVTEERLENLYSVSNFAKLSESKNENPEEKLKEEEEGKEKQANIQNALRKIGNSLHKNWDKFEEKVKEVLKEFNFKQNFIESIIIALSEHDETADYVFDTKGKYIPDSNLRDSEKIPLKQNIEEYFKKEVTPYYKDAWMDRTKDKIGYEINFTKYFYKYKPPRELDKISEDINKLTKEIQDLLKEEL